MVKSIFLKGKPPHVQRQHVLRGRLHPVSPLLMYESQKLVTFSQLRNCVRQYMISKLSRPVDAIRIRCWIYIGQVFSCTNDRIHYACVLFVLPLLSVDAISPASYTPCSLRQKVSLRQVEGCNIRSCRAVDKNFQTVQDLARALLKAISFLENPGSQCCHGHCCIETTHVNALIVRDIILNECAMAAIIFGKCQFLRTLGIRGFFRELCPPDLT